MNLAQKRRHKDATFLTPIKIVAHPPENVNEAGQPHCVKDSHGKVEAAMHYNGWGHLLKK